MKKLLYLLLLISTAATAQIDTSQINLYSDQATWWNQEQIRINTQTSNLAKYFKAYNAACDTIKQLRAQIIAQQKPILGFNIHTFNSAIYSNIDSTISKCKQAGGTALRVNVNVTNAGVLSNESKFAELAAKCKANGIKLMPMVNIDYGDVKSGYDACVAIGKGIGKYDWETAELGNEQSIKNWDGLGKRCLQRNDGISLSDYDTVLLKQICIATKGIADGIRSVNSKMKIIHDGEWLHMEFTNQLINVYKCPIDILAWHFYSSQWKAMAGKTPIDEQLKAKFPGIPIFFNEVGIDYNTDGTVSQDNIDNFKLMYAKLRRYGVIIYELMDESQAGGKEAYFGVFDKSFKKKPIFDLLK